LHDFARIAHLRKEQGITQVQLAESLGVSQQTITAYEVGRRRIQVSTLPVIAQVFGVTAEALVAEAPTPAKREPAPRLQQQLERPRAAQNQAADDQRSPRLADRLSRTLKRQRSARGLGVAVTLFGRYAAGQGPPYYV